MSCQIQLQSDNGYFVQKLSVSDRSREHCYIHTLITELSMLCTFTKLQMTCEVVCVVCLYYVCASSAVLCL